ncbi:PIN domain-containing protein [Kitasatospora sp. NPDC058046]|uniref:PIN domain-containing protein n=1 Tax=Kitasatospora sp. NPDC058046 TaxID=3346312 RepID=UPI0036D85D47
MMIVLDSSVLFGLGPDSPVLDTLRALQLSGRHRVAVPWMVREELLARREADHRHAHARAVTALKELARSAPWATVPTPERFSAESGHTYWHRDLAHRFETLPLSGKAARQALAREARAQKPARAGEGKDTRKSGARDTAIWLSTVEYLRRNPGEQVCFVSANTRDFGDGRVYPPPMDADICGLEDRMTHLTSIDALFGLVTRPLDTGRPDARTRLDVLLRSSRARAAMRAEAERLLNSGQETWSASVLGPARAPVPAGSRTVCWNRWATVPRAVPGHVTDITGLEIDGEHWYTATVDWYLLGVALCSQPGSGSTTRRIACQWRTRLLLGSQSLLCPTVLRHWPAAALPEPGRPRWEAVLAEYADQVPRVEQVDDWARQRLDAELERLSTTATGDRPRR